jgi:hypothetical protein
LGALLVVAGCGTWHLEQLEGYTIRLARAPR